MSIYITHHPERGAPLQLAGEASSDCINVHFTLAEAIEASQGCRERRKRNYGIETGNLYVTQGGRAPVLHIEH